MFSLGSSSRTRDFMKSAFEYQGSLYIINELGEIFKDANGDQLVWTKVAEIDLERSKINNQVLHIKENYYVLQNTE